MLERDPACPGTVDLQQCRISAHGIDAPFGFPADTRHRFLAGLGDIDLTLQHRDDVVRCEARWRPALPTTARRR
ncbi:hypothetical protein [Streptomyces sclerotialus]|uniref:hypothetical protein n=1 Tax=Streptomyces sclerotialus TaxID=1957 RepID=UPI00068B9A26